MGMKNTQGFRILLLITLGVSILLAGTVFVGVNSVRTKMRESSFKELVNSTKHLVNDFHTLVKTDRTILTAIADVVATQPLSDTEPLAELMAYVSGGSLFIDRVMLLLPDNQVVTPDGRMLDVSGELDFAEEAKKGCYISKRRTDVMDPEKLAVYHAVPVEQNGQIAAILYGVLLLEETSQSYEMDLYDGDGFVVIVDGDTSEVILDTWHEHLGLFSDFFDRDMQMGSFQEAEKNIQKGISGDLAFISKTIGSTLYLHYEPMEINNWSIFLGITEQQAFAGMRSTMRSLYKMMVVIVVVLLIYTLVIVLVLFRMNRALYQMSIEDPCTGLLNRNAYERCLLKNRSCQFDKIACVFVDANGLHELNNQYGHDAGDIFLQTVAKNLRLQWKDGEIYRIGGDEFVLFPQDTEKEHYQQAVCRLNEALAQHQYSVSIGFACLENETGLDRVVQEADDRMLENKREYYKNHDRRKAR